MFWMEKNSEVSKNIIKIRIGSSADTFF